MDYRQETKGSGRWGGFTLETSFDWGAIRISTRAYLALNTHQRSRRRGNKQHIEIEFADDTKLSRKSNGNGDKQQLQDDIDKLTKWSEKWQMVFNFEKM